MEYKHRYNWDGDTVLSFEFPLVVGMKFVDLKTGQVYLVHSVGTANKWDRVGDKRPDETVRTADAGTLSPEELEALRQKCQFEDSPLALRSRSSPGSASKSPPLTKKIVARCVRRPGYFLGSGHGRGEGGMPTSGNQGDLKS
jgi:hypothetical protein